MKIEMTKELNLDDLFQTKTEERIVDVYVYDANGIPRFFARRTYGRDFFEFRQNLESKGYKIHSTNFISTDKTEVYFEQPEFIELQKFNEETKEEVFERKKKDFFEGKIWDYDSATKEEREAYWQILTDKEYATFDELINAGYTMKEINQIMKERKK